MSRTFVELEIRPVQRTFELLAKSDWSNSAARRTPTSFFFFFLPYFCSALASFRRRLATGNKVVRRSLVSLCGICNHRSLTCSASRGLWLQTFSFFFFVFFYSFESLGRRNDHSVLCFVTLSRTWLKTNVGERTVRETRSSLTVLLQKLHTNRKLERDG